MGYDNHIWLLRKFFYSTQPKITNVVFSDGVTEKSHIFNTSMKRFDILARKGRSFRFAYTQNGTSSVFKTVPKNAGYFEVFIKDFLTIFLLVPDATSGNPETLEILEWKSVD